MVREETGEDFEVASPQATRLIELLATRGIFLTPALNIDESSHSVSDVAQASHPDNRSSFSRTFAWR
jgi:hypothetical protein